LQAAASWGSGAHWDDQEQRLVELRYEMVPLDEPSATPEEGAAGDAARMFAGGTQRRTADGMYYLGEAWTPPAGANA
jgi:hypothetical protein